MSVCSKCGSKLEGGEKFCGVCGAPVSGAPPSPGAPEAAPPRSPGRGGGNRTKAVGAVVVVVLLATAGFYLYTSNQISQNNSSLNRNLSSYHSSLATQCSAGYVYAGGTCCPVNYPYYDPSTNLCYASPPGSSSLSTHSSSTYSAYTVSTSSSPSSSFAYSTTTSTASTQTGFPFTVQLGSGSLLFSGCIDGSDWLYIKGSSVWLVHRNYVLPGWQKECVAMSNGGSWQPTWYTNSTRAATYTPGVGVSAPNGTTSSVFTLSQSIVVTGFTVEQGRESVTLVQTPSASNQNEAIFLINDDFDLGAAIYTISIQYTPG